MSEVMLVLAALLVGFYIGALVMALKADRRMDEERARWQRLHPAQFRSRPVVTTSSPHRVTVLTTTNDSETLP